jgi:hypothetical protein
MVKRRFSANTLAASELLLLRRFPGEGRVMHKAFWARGVRIARQFSIARNVLCFTTERTSHQTGRKFMNDQNDAWEAPAHQLAKLIEAAETAEDHCTPTELKAILAGELDANIATHLGIDQLDHDTAGSDRVKTVRELLAQATPPGRLLQLTMAHAKLTLDDQRSGTGIPQEVTRALYLATVVVAKRHGIRSLGMADAQFREGIQWCIDQPWMDDGLRSLFKEALERDFVSPELNRK